MGCCSTLFKWYCNFLAVSAVGLVVIYLTPGILPNISFEYYEVDPAAPLKPNSILNNARVLVEGNMAGPESIAIRGDDELFTGDSTGKIWKYKDGKLSQVIQLGFPCAKLDTKVCSYPLGLRFDNNGKLIVADMYGGILRVNVDTGSFETLASRFDPIDGKYPGISEDVAVAKDGSIYWSDGTTVASPENAAFGWLGHSQGRLLKYNPKTNTSEVLVDKINFSNGVQLSDDEEFVLVAEFFRFRIVRYYLKGKKKGVIDVFATGLPGFPDNIRSNGKGGYYIGMPVPRPPFELGRYPVLRKMLARVLYLARATIHYIYSIYPTSYLAMTDFSLLALADEVINIITFIPNFLNANNNGLIVELNKDGEIIGTLQGTNGKLSMLSQMTLGAKHAYLVAPASDKIWVIDRADLNK